MKKSVIGICISLLCVGTGVYVNQQNNATSPVVSTVAKSTKDSKVNTNESKSKVSKHEEAENLEEVGNATNSETEKKTDAVSKESSSVKAETKSSTKAETKSPVSSEGKKQTSSNQTNTTKKDNSASNVSGSKESETKPVEKPSAPVQEPVVEPSLVPEPTRPSYACPGGVNQDMACDVILDQNHYFATYSSQAEADSAGVYYMNEVMYIGETEITNYSVQAVYRNDHSIAYYGLNLWSNGSLIQ